MMMVTLGRGAWELKHGLKINMKLVRFMVIMCPFWCVLSLWENMDGSSGSRLGGSAAMSSAVTAVS